MASELSDKEVHNRQQDLSQDPQQEIISKGDNTQILINNIPESATEESIQKTFEKFGKILKIKIIQDMEGKPNGEALIEFATKQEKDLVLNSNEEFELEGKKIEVKDPSNEGLTLFVGNIPYTAREEDVIQFFSDCGKVDVKFFYINNSFKGYAYVTFQDENAVETALKKNREKLGEREIKIEKLKSRNFINIQRGRRGGYRGGGGRGRGGPPFGHFDRERKEDYFRERRDRYREFDRGRPYNRPRDREREWNRERRERSRDRSREYSRIRDRGEKSRNDRGERERDRHRDYERERDRERGERGDRGDRGDKERDRERDRGERGDRGDRGDRERDREREREREREKENERHREYERERINRDNRERDRDRDRERRHSNYDTDKW